MVEHLYCSYFWNLIVLIVGGGMVSSGGLIVV